MSKIRVSDAFYKDDVEIAVALSCCRYFHGSTVPMLQQFQCRAQSYLGQVSDFFICFHIQVVTLLGEQGARRRGERLIILLLKCTWNMGIRQTIPDLRHGENQGLRILWNQMRRTETGEEKSNTDRD